MNNERETKSGTKPDLWASTAPLREKGGSGAAGTLWGERPFLGKQPSVWIIKLIIFEITVATESQMYSFEN